jgi:hypothetical protein
VGFAVENPEIQNEHRKDDNPENNPQHT